MNEKQLRARANEVLDVLPKNSGEALQVLGAVMTALLCTFASDPVAAARSLGDSIANDVESTINHKIAADALKNGGIQ